MMEACYLVHRICFEVLGMHRMYGALASENKSSYRMTRFLGYVQEGLRRKHWTHPDGFFDDVIVVGLFADEFQQQKRTIEQRLYPELPIPPITDEQAVRIRGLVASQSQERGVSRCSGGTARPVGRAVLCQTVLLTSALLSAARPTSGTVASSPA